MDDLRQDLDGVAAAKGRCQHGLVGITAGLRSFARTDPAVVEVIRAFARTHARVDDAWWDEALASAPPVDAIVGFSPLRDSPAAFALEDVVDGPLGLARWKAMHGFAGMQQVWVPFSFDAGDEPPFWAQLQVADERVLIGNPITLLDYWAGGWIGRDQEPPMDPGDPYEREQIDYARRARAAYETFQRDSLASFDARLAMEYAMMRLLRTAWDSKAIATLSW